ncbi:MAG TPA: SgcJ/EcaC family oxidoreductase [Candidatus Acidoferrales bacterium]|nr:SgcJ/EcaC family oxidoreductase [Candidatus Acidoferrales bacterium]
MNLSLRPLSFVMFLSTAGFLAAQQPPASKSSGEAARIRAVEKAMMVAGEEKGATGYMSFYADDAVELSAGQNALVGKNAIANTMTFLDDKTNRLTWTPLHVDVAASGDLAYTYGTYEFHSMGKDGKPAVEYGKYATVWKKQKDGQWKVVLDTGNSSPSPAPASKPL